MSFIIKQITDIGGEEVVIDESSPVIELTEPELPLTSSSADGDSCGRSVCDGYDGDYDNEDNDTVCDDDSPTSDHNQRQLKFDLKDSNNNNKPLIADNYSKPKWIFIGTHVLSRWTDGLFYMGLVVQIDSIAKKCLIQFEDSSLFWIRFEDLHKQLSVGTVMADSDILCVTCRDGRSEAPNEIVICDVCNQGYHQKCHKPRIGDDILEPDIPWTCRLCVFALGTKEGGAEKNGVIGRALKHMKSELPYELSALVWDDSHLTNKDKKYCYCGGNGNYFSKMLQCSTCHQWFHEACIQALETPLLYGDHYYTFKCSVCNAGKELLKRIIMKWSDMIALVINNLALQHQKQFFDLSVDIVPFVQNNSNMLKTSEDITKLTERQLQERVSAVLNTNHNRFINGKEVHKRSSLWALRVAFPFETPLMFAPPFALQSPTTSSTATSAPFPFNTMPSEPNPTPKVTAASVTHIYGACRKGASKYPTLSTSKKLLKNGRSNSFSSSTGSNSCNASTLSFSSRCSLSTASLTSKMKAKKRSNAKLKANPKTEKRVAKFTSLAPNSEDSSDSELISTQVIDSLEAAIPVPKDFEGDNNPFSDSHHNISLRNRLSKSPVSGGLLATEVKRSERISCRLEAKEVNGGAGSPEAKTSPTMECFKNVRNGANDRFNILAQRVRPDGKTEYLLEW